MKSFHSLGVACVLVVGADAVAAQSRVAIGKCTEESGKASFALTDSNRLSASQFVTKIVGQRVTFQRRQTDAAVDLRFVVIYRADGSFSHSCEWRARGGTYHTIRDWAPCDRVTVRGGSRDVGTWRVADAKGLFCVKRTGGESEGQKEGCFTVHENAGQFALRVFDLAMSCWPGNIEIGRPGG